MTHTFAAVTHAFPKLLHRCGMRALGAWLGPAPSLNTVPVFQGQGTCRPSTTQCCHRSFWLSRVSLQTSNPSRTSRGSAWPKRRDVPPPLPSGTLRTGSQDNDSHSTGLREKTALGLLETKACSREDLEAIKSKHLPHTRRGTRKQRGLLLPIGLHAPPQYTHLISESFLFKSSTH